MNQKIFGTVILYYPPKNFMENILTYLSIIDKLIIIDNSEIPILINKSQLPDNTIIIQDKTNKGIAERLNIAAKIASKEGADWLLTMDQDSFFSKESIAKYVACFEDFINKNQVAMFGVNHEKIIHELDCKYIHIDNLITSGSLVNLNLTSLIGEFDEKLFIDEVDTEYCFRAIKHGFKIVKFENVFLNHSLGEVSHFRSIKNFKKTQRTLHSPTRLYYMVRNFFYIKDAYNASHSHTLHIKQVDILNRIKNNFLYGNKRLAVLKNVLLGYWHYKKGVFGKLKSNK